MVRHALAAVVALAPASPACFHTFSKAAFSVHLLLFSLADRSAFGVLLNLPRRSLASKVDPFIVVLFASPIVCLPFACKRYLHPTLVACPSRCLQNS